MVNQLPPNVQFRPMQPEDLNTALQIIYETDEDDYETAAEEFQDEGVDGHYVLTKDGAVIGLTGCECMDEDDITDGSFFLSWTYLSQKHRGEGLGTMLLEQMLEVIRQNNGRKVFVSTSDYVDPEKGDVYRAARQLYSQAGFTEELRHPNYYNPTEAMITFGLRLEQLQPRQSFRPEGRKISLKDIDEIAETEDAYAISWEYTDGEGSTSVDFQRVIQEVEKWEGRVIFVAIPSDAEQLIQLMVNCRFRQEGQLADYFEDGIHEVHFRYDLALR